MHSTAHPRQLFLPLHCSLLQVLWLALPESPGKLWFADPRGPGATCGASDLAVTPISGGTALFPSWLEHWVSHHVAHPAPGNDGGDDGDGDGGGGSESQERVVVPFNALVEQREPDSMGFKLRVPLAHLRVPAATSG
jgi:hypothetical protein